MEGTVGLILIVGFLFLLSIKSWFYIVNGKQAAILETLGKPHKQAYGPGFHVKLPWPITVVVGRMSTQIQQMDATVEVKTKDNVFMSMPVKVQMRVDDRPESVVKAYYELDDATKQVSAYVLNTVRQTCANMDMADLYSSRDKIEQDVTRELQDKFGRFGYIVENVLVDQPMPPKSIQESFNNVIASKRLKEAAEFDAEAIRIKMVGAARAESESKKLQGEGMAQMREAIAKGLENSMTTLRNAGLSPTEATAFLTDTNRLDTMANVASHGNVMILDVANGSVFGQTLAGVAAAELLPKKVTK